MRRRAIAVDLNAPPGERVYQCVLVDGVWHMTQEQMTPPPVLAGAAWTTCDRWAEFKRGYERRRPTCPTCLNAAERDECV